MIVYGRYSNCNYLVKFSYGCSTTWALYHPGSNISYNQAACSARTAMHPERDYTAQCSAVA